MAQSGESVIDGLRNRKILFWRKFWFYLLAGLGGAAAASEFIKRLCEIWIEALLRRQLGIKWQGTYTELINVSYDGKRLTVFLYHMLRYGVYFVCFAAIVIAVVLYYRHYVKPGMLALSQLFLQIKNGEYSVPVCCTESDLFGDLCAEAEQARQLLLTRQRMRNADWEEQRKINAAFAHDIRTPLTVVRGYTDFLLKYLPSGRLTDCQILEKVRLISEQESRLNAFCDTMSVLHQLEERDVCRSPLLWEELILAFQKQAAAVFGATNLSADVTEGVHEQSRALLVDLSVILETVDNICSNALRHAGKKVEIFVEQEKEFLTVQIKDDGKGFSNRALLSASDAYFREESKDAAGKGHFGLGLTIARILCERHGGSLTIVNSVKRGAIVTAVFRCF